MGPKTDLEENGKPRPQWVSNPKTVQLVPSSYIEYAVFGR